MAVQELDPVLLGQQPKARLDQPLPSFDRLAKLKGVKVKYTEQVEYVLARATEDQAIKPSKAVEALLEIDLSDVVGLAQEMWEALPISAKVRTPRCAGLPRTYPKFWMHRPESNSNMMEFKLLWTGQSKPVRKVAK